MYLLSSYFLLLLFLNDQINVQASLSATYRHLAKLYCYIDDYSIWLEQQTTLHYFLQFIKFFDLDTKRIEAELERYRLQHECLRAVERLPILVGNG
jgi:hypothetical protein